MDMVWFSDEHLTAQAELVLGYVFDSDLDILCRS